MLPNGFWVPARKLVDQEYVRRWASFHEVDRDDCYGFFDENGVGLLMHWSGDKFSILSIVANDLNRTGKMLVGSVKERSKTDPDARFATFLQAERLGSMGPYAVSVIPFYKKQL